MRYSGVSKRYSDRRYYLYVSPGRGEWSQLQPTPKELHATRRPRPTDYRPILTICHTVNRDIHGDITGLVGARPITRHVTAIERTLTTDNRTLTRLRDSAGEWWIALRTDNGYVTTAETHL